MDDMTWSEPKFVKTKYGERILTKAAPTQSFWKRWNEDKSAVKKEGYSLTKDDEGNWEVLHWGEIEGKDELIEASKSLGSKFDVPAPEGKDYFPYQRAGVEYIVQREKTLLADSMGLGKTIEVIGAINWWNANNQPIKKILIVCPNSLKYNWKKELEAWLTDDYRIGIVERQDYPEEYDILIINYDVASKHKKKLHAVEWDLFVADESHYIKNQDAQRTQALIGKGKKIKGLNAKRAVFMTGTPITNKPLDLFTPLSYLDPKRWYSWWSFAKRYEGIYRGAFGIEFSGPQNLEELQDILRSSIMIRRLKEDVLKELPEKIRQVIPLNPDKETRKLLAQEKEILYIKSLADDAALRMDEGEGSDIGTLALLRKEIAMRKLPDVKEMINETLDNGEKVIVFAHHRDVVKSLYEEYSDKAVFITGDVKSEDRQKAVDEFQENDDVRVFIGNIKAAGVGITLTAASHVIFAEITWTPSDLMQAEDRSLRIGQKNNVLVQYPLYEDSVDIKMMNAVIRKQDASDRALDNEYELPEMVISEAKEKHAGEKPVKEYTDAERAEFHANMRYLAGLDSDFAATQNNMGFSKTDTVIGHSLAEAPYLSNKQAMIAEKLSHKYRRQLGD